MGLADEIRQVARGWRWGRRTMTPRSALESTPPPKAWDFPTDWARSEAAGVARDVILDGGLRTIIWNELTPEVFGLDNLDGVRGPVMFISNHSSHLDASIIMISLPASWRRKTATAAAKDYFFDVWWRSAFTALVYAGFPVERGAG
ncbi:MAG TPA: 1-acyl-sn-glycerol-3-phosphate acyltransferase, partial [Actinomycetota bacterium]